MHALRTRQHWTLDFVSDRTMRDFPEKVWKNLHDENWAGCLRRRLTYPGDLCRRFKLPMKCPKVASPRSINSFIEVRLFLASRFYIFSRLVGPRGMIVQARSLCRSTSFLVLYIRWILGFPRQPEMERQTVCCNW